MADLTCGAIQRVTFNTHEINPRFQCYYLYIRVYIKFRLIRCCVNNTPLRWEGVGCMEIITAHPYHTSNIHYTRDSHV
jgi:hypothetical protein